MWPTIDGLRILKDAEAVVVSEAVIAMVDQLAAECRDESEHDPLGIDWFDQWDCYQRLWLLEHVVAALFTPTPPLSPAAIWEATVDAIFCQVVELIAMEIDQSPSSESGRNAAIEAFRCQHGRLPKISADETDIRQWRSLVTQIADMILGVTSYQKAEAFRDGDIQRSRKFLIQKALPEDFLERIPPLRTLEQAEQSIARIQSIVR
jgi:hypothetical protein